MKKYLTLQSIVLALLVIGVVILLWIIITRNATPTDPTVIKQLQQQQKELQKLSEEKQRENEANKVRDSILWAKLTENDKSRNVQLGNINRSKNEKINHINSDGFTADSIRKLFSEN